MALNAVKDNIGGAMYTTDSVSCIVRRVVIG